MEPSAVLSPLLGTYYIEESSLVYVCLVIIRTWLLYNIHHSFECANPANTHISCTCNITKTSPSMLANERGFSSIYNNNNSIG